MFEENVSQEIRLKNIDKIRNYLIKEINKNQILSKKHKKVCRVLRYIEHLLTATSTVSECMSISAFVSLVGILIGNTDSAIGLKVCVITAGIKKYKLKITRKKKNDQIVLLAKSKVNSMEVLISNTLIDIIHDEFVLINNVLKEFYNMKEETKIFSDK